MLSKACGHPQPAIVTMEQGPAQLRAVCPQCGRSKGMGYCPDCLVVLEDNAPTLPPLPVQASAAAAAAATAACCRRQPLSRLQ